MRELRAEDSILARALEFAILAGSRSAKVREAKWNEIDMASAHPRRAHEVRPAARRPAVRACRGSAGHHAARAIDRVIYAGTFSKLLFPAIRLAYLVLPERLIDPFVSALSLTARHMPIWNQVIWLTSSPRGTFRDIFAACACFIPNAPKRCKRLHKPIGAISLSCQGLNPASMWLFCSSRESMTKRLQPQQREPASNFVPCLGIHNDALVSVALSLASLQSTRARSLMEPAGLRAFLRSSLLERARRLAGIDFPNLGSGAR
jgi:hypothetical protein